MTLEEQIKDLFENPAKLAGKAEQKLVLDIIDQLDRGELRIAEKRGEQWQVNVFAKQAVLLYFRIQANAPLDAGCFEYFDKIPVKKRASLKDVRVVPGAIARKGSFIEAGAILMPSYVNIGAYVGAGTMVDTWATVGSCAQIGKNVHLSGGVGIGGVLEPAQASPVIIEDNAFVGSRCIVVEGVRVEEGAVLGANVVLTKSTRIIDVTGKEAREYKGLVPARSVVIPGTRIKEFPAGSFGVPVALIIGKRSAATDEKTSLNEVLRTHDIAV
jgi:2,3,4,5-tetrahydropyridine-2-carboxylate N-succinyltransferase